MNQQQTGARAQVMGRITTAPQLARTMEGVAVCRFVVATDAGPASNPVVKPIYVLGRRAAKPSEDLPVRCTRLGVGDLVFVPGTERQRVRRRRGVRYTESAIEAEDVRLKARAGEAR